MPYPFAYFLQQEGGNTILKTFSVPQEGNTASNIVPNTQLQQAFNFQPGFILKVNAQGFGEEEWEVVVSAYNETYFHCRQYNAYAYFINNGTMFYFTNYFGSRKSLLYLFYQAAYKVLLSTEKRITIADTFPQNIFGKHPLKWIQDLLSPFGIFLKMQYSSYVKQDDDTLGGGSILLESRADQQMAGTLKEKMQARVEISNGRIHSFRVELNNKTIEAICGK